MPFVSNDYVVLADDGGVYLHRGATLYAWRTADTDMIIERKKDGTTVIFLDPAVNLTVTPSSTVLPESWGPCFVSRG